MPLNALMVIEYKEKYNNYISMLAEGHKNLSHIARTIGVDTKTLYNWAKRECFKEDLDIAVRGLLALNVRKVINGVMAKAEQGEAPAAKLYLQHETGWNEKQEVKAEVSINADAVVMGILNAVKKNALPEEG